MITPDKSDFAFANKFLSNLHHSKSSNLQQLAESLETDKFSRSGRWFRKDLSTRPKSEGRVAKFFSQFSLIRDLYWKANSKKTVARLEAIKQVLLEKGNDIDKIAFNKIAQAFNTVSNRSDRKVAEFRIPVLTTRLSALEEKINSISSDQRLMNRLTTSHSHLKASFERLQHVVEHEKGRLAKHAASAKEKHLSDDGSDLDRMLFQNLRIWYHYLGSEIKQLRTDLESEAIQIKQEPESEDKIESVQGSKLKESHFSIEESKNQGTVTEIFYTAVESFTSPNENRYQEPEVIDVSQLELSELNTTAQADSTPVSEVVQNEIEDFSTIGSISTEAAKSIVDTTITLDAFTKLDSLKEDALNLPENYFSEFEEGLSTRSEKEKINEYDAKLEQIFNKVASSITNEDTAWEELQGIVRANKRNPPDYYVTFVETIANAILQYAQKTINVESLEKLLDHFNNNDLIVDRDFIRKRIGDLKDSKEFEQDSQVEITQHKTTPGRSFDARSKEKDVKTTSTDTHHDVKGDKHKRNAVKNSGEKQTGLNEAELEWTQAKNDICTELNKVLSEFRKVEKFISPQKENNETDESADSYKERLIVLQESLTPFSAALNLFMSTNMKTVVDFEKQTSQYKEFLAALKESTPLIIQTLRATGLGDNYTGHLRIPFDENAVHALTKPLTIFSQFLNVNVRQQQNIKEVAKKLSNACIEIQSLYPQVDTEVLGTLSFSDLKEAVRFQCNSHHIILDDNDSPIRNPKQLVNRLEELKTEVKEKNNPGFEAFIIRAHARALALPSNQKRTLSAEEFRGFILKSFNTYFKQDGVISSCPKSSDLKEIQEWFLKKLVPSILSDIETDVQTLEDNVSASVVQTKIDLANELTQFEELLEKSNEVIARTEITTDDREQTLQMKARIEQKIEEIQETQRNFPEYVKMIGNIVDQLVGVKDLLQKSDTSSLATICASIDTISDNFALLVKSYDNLSQGYYQTFNKIKAASAYFNEVKTQL